MSPRRSRFRFTPLHLAGWLFADMLLVLALVSMGDRGDPLAARAAAHRSPSAAGKPSPEPSRTPSGPRSVERKPVKVHVTAAVGDTTRMVKQLHAATARYKSRTAAFVLTFGQAPEPGDGQAYAREINKSLRKARPGMFADATTRDFWNGGAAGAADLEIYFYTR
ncbi:hypothetical protein [Streptomyces sp. HUAS TT20]|uniref:hypothetical protein n=1 Tax=Streptomyces sp. HUAS TT20 TaxID=3447509 RepID=UPI0021DA6417|nr:hypothetical protein [Streptomyces sp. HUAS 15-9]UXY31075.1 hypothetical protein N8I87_34010 [Streptomyces sp. HUAS 15-9]